MKSSRCGSGFGDCARDGFISNNCAQGSDGSPEKVFIGVPVRVDRFRPGAAAEPDAWLMTTTLQYARDAEFIKPEGLHPDRNVSFATIAQTDTYIYDTALPVSHTDEIRHPSARQEPPRQGGSEAHVRSTRDYDAAGNLQVTTEYGRVAPNDKSLDTVVRTETFPTTQRCEQNWACPPRASRIVETRPDETFDTALRSFEFGYNVASDLTDVSGDLDYPRSERAALSRIPGLGTTAPSTASTLAGKRQLRRFGYDEFGNLVSTRGHSPASIVCT